LADNLADRLIEGDPAGSLFQDIFTSDITLARIRCLTCDSTIGAGSLSVCPAPTGACLRCTSCGDALIKAVNTAHGLWFEMTAACLLWR